MPDQIFFRLRCGHRVWSRWLEHEHEAWQVAVDRGLASNDRRGNLYPGPLVWVEKGRRRYARRRTEPMTAELDGSPLPDKHWNPLIPRPEPKTYAWWQMPW